MVYNILLYHNKRQNSAISDRPALCYNKQGRSLPGHVRYGCGRTPAPLPLPTRHAGAATAWPGGAGRTHSVSQ